MMTDHQRDRELTHLLEVCGMSAEEAERVLEDKDLWMQPAEYRYAFLDVQEDVRQWEMAHAFAEALYEGFFDSLAANEATQQLLCEVRMKAAEALRRAKLRQERATRPAGEITQGEEEKLREQLRRSTALGNAHTALLDSGLSYETLQEDLQLLEEMCQEVNEQFELYRREVGLPEPGTRTNDDSEAKEEE